MRSQHDVMCISDLKLFPMTFSPGDIILVGIQGKPSDPWPWMGLVTQINAETLEFDWMARSKTDDGFWITDRQHPKIGFDIYKKTSVMATIHGWNIREKMPSSLQEDLNHFRSM